MSPSITSPSSSDTRIPNRPWFSLARALVTASRLSDVLSALETALAEAGCPPEQVQFFSTSSSCSQSRWRPSSAKPSGQGTFVFPLENSRAAPALVLTFAPSAWSNQKGLRECLTPYVELALAALRRMWTQDRMWQEFLSMVNRVGAAIAEEEVLEQLVAAVTDLFAVPFAQVLRHVPEESGVRVEVAGGTLTQHWRPLRHQVFPLELLPGHHKVLETGEVALFHQGEAGEMNKAEFSLLYPPQVKSCLCMPFWLGTEAIGLLCLAVGEEACPREIDDLPVPMLRALLYHASVAMERANLFRAVSMARREADLLLEKTFTGILLLDTSLKVIRANAAAATVWHVDPQTLYGKHVTDLFGPKIMQVHSPLARAIQEHAAQDPVELVVRAANGGSRDILLAVTPLLGQSDVPLGYLLSLVDISELKEVERLKDQILANVSHEMRTPVAVIKGYAEMLQRMGEEMTGDMWRDSLRIMEEQADQLTGLIQMYLDLSQLEAGQFSLHREVIHVESAVENACTPHRHLEARKKVSVDLAVAPDVAEAWLDRHLFQQVVRNLVENAIKFTPPSGRVSVRVWGEEKDLYVEVEDEGSGIEPTDLPHIFDRFYRGRSSHYGVPGTGLGLTLVKQAVEAHGGEVSVKSEPGRGSTFRVVFPDVLQLPPP